MKKWALTLAGTASVAIIAVAVVLAITQSPSPTTQTASSTAASPAEAAKAVRPASLIRVPSFGANPAKDTMYVYVPHSVRPHPAILLALHWACGSGPEFYQGTGYSTLADAYGFIVIYPSSNPADSCWDTDSFQALRRGAGSDPTSLMSMITYTERTYHANPHRVYVTGASAGGMMTAVMLGDYPDVFAAGSIMEGVPFGCPQACAQVPTSFPAAEWGTIARGGDPGYHGPRPRVQIWQGTADQNVLYANFTEEIKQWTNVAGVSQAPVATEHPQPGWTLTEYGPGKNNVAVDAYSLAGVGHVLPEAGMEVWVIRFFGLGQG